MSLNCNYFVTIGSILCENPVVTNKSVSFFLLRIEFTVFFSYLGKRVTKYVTVRYFLWEWEVQNDENLLYVINV